MPEELKETQDAQVEQSAEVSPETEQAVEPQEQPVEESSEVEPQPTQPDDFIPTPEA